MEWDRTNQSGGRVSPGAYFVKIEVGAFIASRPLLLLR